MVVARNLLGLIVLVATPAVAADFDLTDVIVGGPPVSLTAPRLEVRGASISRDEALALLAPTGGASSIAGLSSLKAERLTAPELVIDTTLFGNAQRTVYRNAVLTGLDHGRLAHVEAAGYESISTAPPRRMTCATVRAAGVDVAAMARGAFDGAGAQGAGAAHADAGAQPAVAAQEFSANDCTIVADNVSITLARVAGKELSTTPSPAPTAGGTALDGAMTIGGASLSSVMITNLVSTLGLSQLTIESAAVAAPDGGGLKPGVTFSTLLMEEVKNGRAGRVRLENLARGAGADKFSVGALVITGLDLKSPIAARAATPPRQASPRFDAFEADAITLGDMTVARMRAEARQWLAIAPTDVSLTFSGLVAPASLAGALGLAKFGYRFVEASGVLTMRYDGEKQTLSLSELGVDGVGVGAARLALNVAHLSPNAFSGDPSPMQAAWAGAALAGVSIRLEDKGLLSAIDAHPETELSRAALLKAAERPLASLVADADQATAAKSVELFVMKGAPLTMDFKAEPPVGFAAMVILGLRALKGFKLVAKAQ